MTPSAWTLSLPGNAKGLPVIWQAFVVFGAGEGNRTPDPLLTRQLLYRLSYAS